MSDIITVNVIDSQEIVSVSVIDDIELIDITVNEIGIAGSNGIGIPPGGEPGQVLAKVDYNDYNTHWVTGGSGGGAVDSVNGKTGIVILNKSDIGLANVDNTSDANKPISTAQAIAINDNSINLSNVMSTGLISGGQLSINADPTKFNIMSGQGVIVDNHTDPINPIRTIVTWADQSGLTDPLLTTDATTYISINSLGAFTYSNNIPSNAERRDSILIGWLDHPNQSIIETVKVQPNSITDVAAQLNDFMLAFGPFNINGNEYSPQSGLHVKRSAGNTFDSNANYVNNRASPNVITTGIESPISFFYYYRDGVGDWFNSVVPQSVIDPDHWDDNSGTLANVPAGNWTVQIISFYSQTQSNDIQYGQKTYATLSAAQSDLQSAIAINPYNAYDTFRAWAIVKQGATDLTNPAQALFVSAGKLGMTSIQSGGGTGGEVNTASNIGLTGIGLYDSKVGVNLQFRNIQGNGDITISLDNSNHSVVLQSNVKPCAAAMAIALS